MIKFLLTLLQEEEDRDQYRKVLEGPELQSCDQEEEGVKSCEGVGHHEPTPSGRDSLGEK